MRPHFLDDGFGNDMIVRIDAFHRFFLLVVVGSFAGYLAGTSINEPAGAPATAGDEYWRSALKR